MKTSWLNTTEYPFAPNYFSVNGQQFHYIDEGVGETILFVHGTPSWSFDFRNVIKGLNGDYRCIAPDHIGFGLSSKPAQYDYSTGNHSKTLERFILEKNLYNITLVVHDFGGPIGLNIAIRHPERIKRIVVLNSWLWSSETDPDFQKLKKMLGSPLLPFLYRYLNFSPRFVLPQSFGEHKLSSKLLKQYTAPFEDSTQRNGTVGFANSLLHDQLWFEELWMAREAICSKPMLLIWGMKDPVLKPAYLSKFASGFPNSRVAKLETSGHFPQEEQPEQVAVLIRDFMNGN